MSSANIDAEQAAGRLSPTNKTDTGEEMARIEVKSEVAGRIWKIEAEVGAALAEEDTILVIESMKMEIPVDAPRKGTLIEIRVAEQDPVAEGQVVAVLEV